MYTLLVLKRRSFTFWTLRSFLTACSLYFKFVCSSHARISRWGKLRMWVPVAAVFLINVCRLSRCGRRVACKQTESGARNRISRSYQRCVGCGKYMRLAQTTWFWRIVPETAMARLAKQCGPCQVRGRYHPQTFRLFSSSAGHNPRGSSGLSEPDIALSTHAQLRNEYSFGMTYLHSTIAERN